jgi:hypothetical protein
MKVIYNNDIKDLIALQKFVLRNTGTGKKMMLHRFLAVETIIVFITIVFAINHNPFRVFLGFVIVSSLAWLFRERSVLLQFRKDFKRERRKDKEGRFDRQRVMSISPSGITVDIGAQQSRYAWDEVDMTGQDKHHVYIILTGVLHYVIPQTAFTNEGKADQFLKKIENYRLSK